MSPTLPKHTLAQVFRSTVETKRFLDLVGTTKFYFVIEVLNFSRKNVTKTIRIGKRIFNTNKFCHTFVDVEVYKLR